jgi:signal transduction histidine kinase
MVRRGVLGLHAPTPIATEHPWGARSILVLHSDGVTTRWRWEDFRHLAKAPATVIARQSLRALAKDNDDATVLVVKNGQAELHSYERKRIAATSGGSRGDSMRAGAGTGRDEPWAGRSDDGVREPGRRAYNGSAHHPGGAAKNHSELLQTTLELEDCVARRTAELRKTNEHLQHELAERQRVEEALHRKDEELRTISQQLWQAAKLATMGELAASIAHELNNPLATVSLRVESLLAQIVEDDPKRRALTVIEQEVERMGNLVANLLQFSHRGQAQISSVDVREELENTLALIHYHLRNHRIIVVRQFASDVPMLHAEHQQLRQVFLNLLTNASDAMPQGGSLTLGVTLGQLEPGVPAVVITFTDTGIGIAPEDMPRVMEPFFTTKAEGKRTGLGLAICRRIVQEHHGTFEISSVVGQGTTIDLKLLCTSATNKTYLRERKL